MLKISALASALLEFQLWAAVKGSWPLSVFRRSRP